VATFAAKMFQHVQVIYFVIRCEAKFSKVRLEIFKCTRVKRLLETNLAPSVKPLNGICWKGLFSVSIKTLTYRKCFCSWYNSNGFLMKTESQIYMKYSWVKDMIKVLLEYEINKQYFDNFVNLNIRKKRNIGRKFWKKIKGKK